MLRFARPLLALSDLGGVSRAVVRLEEAPVTLHSRAGEDQPTVVGFGGHESRLTLLNNLLSLPFGLIICILEQFPRLNHRGVLTSRSVWMPAEFCAD